MRIMDRYLFWNFIGSYLICFVSMVGLYVVIDLFANADEFLEDHAGTVAFVRRAGKFYFIHSFEYFGKLSPIITQIAAMVTLASLHRHNEIIALLAAGIPTRRALMPILLGAVVMISLRVINREIVLPMNSSMLQRLHEDIEADHTIFPSTVIDKDQVLFQAQLAHREDLSLENVHITFPLEVVGQLQNVHAKQAFYVQDPKSNEWCWKLVQHTPLQIQRANEKVRIDGDVIYLQSNVTFQDVIRHRNWKNFASTAELIGQLQSETLKDPNEVRIIVHNRFMQPIMDLLLVLIGIPFVLQWERKNIYRSVAVSMLLSAAFFVVDASAGYFANHGHVDPLTAAWIPVFFFAPLSLSLMHRVGT
ncbi:MAG: LptF/LptG family permease [Planctomycetota bacterium]